MPTNISGSAASKYINGNVLEAKECGAKPDSHGVSVVTVSSCRKSKATLTLLRFHFYPFLLMKTLPVHIAPFSNRYAMKTIGVHIAPAKRCC